MSTQTMVATTETIICMITMGGGGGGKDPLPPRSSSDLQHIRDTFDIILG
jgi:hypothetical protein